MGIFQLVKNHFLLLANTTMHNYADEYSIVPQFHVWLIHKL